ncbi:MAG: hypothetical protein NC342_05905 [Pseudoflavonifractor sp.]|nr:hypothetical protein [Alloprevotella sp.]MCM1117051.1 hypothetical protein [Pseudoflavonifractor sp.]
MPIKTQAPQRDKDADAMEYPGVANNKADDDKVNPCLVKQDVKELNNNPRNGDMQMP